MDNNLWAVLNPLEAIQLRHLVSRLGQKLLVHLVFFAMLCVCRRQVGAHVTARWLQEPRTRHDRSRGRLCRHCRPWPIAEETEDAGSTPYNLTISLLFWQFHSNAEVNYEVLSSLTSYILLVARKNVWTIVKVETELSFKILQIPREATPIAKTVGIVQLHDNEQNPRFPTKIWMFGVFLIARKTTSSWFRNAIK